MLKLLFVLQDKTDLQKDLFLRFVVENLPHVNLDDSSKLKSTFDFSAHEQASNLLLDFCLDYLLLPYR